MMRVYRQPINLHFRDNQFAVYASICLEMEYNLWVFLYHCGKYYYGRSALSDQTIDIKMINRH